MSKVRAKEDAIKRNVPTLGSKAEVFLLPPETGNLAICFS